MSETSEATDLVASTDETNAQIEEVFEEIARAVEGEAAEAEIVEAEVVEAPVAAVAKPDAPAKKKAPAKRKPAKESELSGTVDSLAGSVATLARTVESLTDRIPVAHVPATESEVEVAREVDPVEIAEFKASFRGWVVDVVTTAGKFLGVGLVGAGAMNVGNSPLWIVAMFIGVAAFTACSAFVVAPSSNPSLVKRAAGALAASVGLGLIVGGVQFFGSDAKLAAKLIPVGVPVFAFGALFGSRYKLSTEHLSWIAGAIVWICLGVFVGLNALAGGSSEATPAPAAPAADASHGATPAADSSPTADSHGTAVTTQAPAAPSTPTTVTASELQAVVEKAKAAEHH